jgi:chromosome partitioning protein
MPQPRDPATGHPGKSATRHPPILAVCGPKGGVGKTTLAVHLAGLLSAPARPCILADLDPQAAATGWLLPDEPPDGWHLAADLEAGRPMRTLPAPASPGVRVAPGHLDLSAWDAGDTRTRARLAVTLRPVEDAACVVVDLPPSWGALLAGTLLVADAVLVAVEARALGVAGLGRILDLIERAQTQNPRLRLLGIVPSRVGRTRLARAVEARLRERYRCVLTSIRECAAVAEAPADGRTLDLIRPGHPAAADFTALAASVRQALHPGRK